MPAWAVVLIGLVAGIVPGALVVTLLALLLLALFRRETLSHACWLIMFLLDTLLVGGVFGAGLGAVIACEWSGRGTVPLWLWLVAAALALLLAWLLIRRGSSWEQTPLWLWLVTRIGAAHTARLSSQSDWEGASENSQTSLHQPQSGAHVPQAGTLSSAMGPHSKTGRSES